MKRVFIVLIAVLILTRLPFFSSSLCGEEGIFAHAVLDVTRGEKPRLLVARDFNGTEYDAVPEHNMAGYVLPGVVLRPLTSILGADARDLEGRISTGRVLRVVFFVIYLAAAAIALSMVAPARRWIAAALIVLFSLPVLPF